MNIKDDIPSNCSDAQLKGKRLVSSATSTADKKNKRPVRCDVQTIEHIVEEKGHLVGSVEHNQV